MVHDAMEEKAREKYIEILSNIMIKNKTTFFDKIIVEDKNWEVIQSYNHTVKCYIIQENKKTVVFQKSNLMNGVYEYLAKELYSLVGIPCAKIEIIKSKEELKILSYSVNENETDYELFSGLDALIESGKSLEDILQLRENLNENEFIEAIELGFLVAKKIIEKNNKNANEDFSRFKVDFLKVIFYDILFDQKDRNLSNWGLLKNKVNGQTYLAPLFDNELCYSYPKENPKYNKFTFNYGYTDFEIVLHTLYNQYYDIIYECTKGIDSKLKENIIYKIKEILGDLSPKYIEELEKRFSAILNAKNKN